MKRLSAISRTTCAAAVLAAVGCQGWPDAPSTTLATLAEEAPPAGAEAVVVRGQSPDQAPEFVAPWGPVYVAPGELACDTPPPIGYEVVVPQPLVAAPRGAAGVTPAQPAPGVFDVLPNDGGAISPDFGLPSGPVVDDRLPNPLYIPVPNALSRIDATWEELADVLSETFAIRTEQQVRLVGDVLTEGALQTRWQAASTILEPWRNDSVGAFNRWQSTLQTLRRRATVRVVPAAAGFEIGVQVDKQLEDLDRPELASAGAASLRHDNALPVDRLSSIDRVRSANRWIDIGRDEPLEQALLRRFRKRLTGG